MDRVAAEVRANMARIRMTQTELAQILGLPQSAISNRLRGKVAFDIDELETVANALGVHPAALLGGRGDNPQSPPSPDTAAYLSDSVTPSDLLTMERLHLTQVAA